MKNFIFCLILLYCNVSFAQRVVMTDNASDTEQPNYNLNDDSVKFFIKKLASDISNEDLSACENSYKSFNRREAAIFFAEHQVSINLMDAHVVANNGKEAEVALKYSMVVDRNIITFISFMRLKEFEGQWKVMGEKICKKNWENPSCVGGRCGGVNVPNFAIQPQDCPDGQCNQNRVPMGTGQQIFPDLEDF